MHPAEGSGRPFLRARPRFVVAGLVAIGLVVVVAGAVLGRWGIGPFANAGGFTRTGSMTTVRVWPTTALLQDGRVLIAGGGSGGVGGGVQLASAELYDPKTGTFSPTGSMSEPRQGALAAVLPNGRVLVIDLGSSHCDLYDPKTGTFSPTGIMARAHIYGTATPLSDGRVLVAGGRTAQGSAMASAELYDPGTGTFGPTGSMASPRLFHTATLLSDGRVLVAGGYDDQPKVQTSAELYDPKTGTFSPTGAMRAPHNPQTAVSLADGRALVIGGPQVGQPVEIFDPKSGLFSKAGSIDGYLYFYYDSPPVRLLDGRVLFWSEFNAQSHSFRFYDPQTGEIRVSGRYDPVLCGPVILLSDGQVLFAGGDTVLPVEGGYLYRP